MNETYGMSISEGKQQDNSVSNYYQTYSRFYKSGHLILGYASLDILSQFILHQQTAHGKNLAKLAKPCETKKPISNLKTVRILYLRNLAKPCETKVKLRNLYLRKTLLNKGKTTKFVFAKPCQCVTRICKTCETWFAKQFFQQWETLRNTNFENCESCENELHCETMIHIIKQCKQHSDFYNGMFTAGRETMLRQTHWDATIRNCRQSPVLYHNSTGLPFCQFHCLTLRLVTGSSEGYAWRHWVVACWGGCRGRGRRGYGRQRS